MRNANQHNISFRAPSEAWRTRVRRAARAEQRSLSAWIIRALESTMNRNNGSAKPFQARKE